MKNAITILTLLLLICLSTVQKTQAQYILKKADAQFELYNYIKAIDLYEQAYKKKQTRYAAERLAMSNNLIRNFKAAESWAAIAANMQGSRPENKLVYANALLQNSKYSEAKKQFENFAKLNPQIPEARKNTWLLSCDSALYWINNPLKGMEIDNQVFLNSTQSDWGLRKKGDTLVYVSDRSNTTENVEDKPFLKFDGQNEPDKNIYGWTGNGYLRLYGYDTETKSLFGFPLDAGTDYHVGPISFTANGKEAFYALTRISKKPKFVKGVLATVNIELYSSVKDEKGNWSAPKPFPYNNINEYSLGDPFISEDGKTIFFVSTLPGGKGGTDIYYSTRNSKGEWGKPVNMEGLNSPGNERNPFISKNFIYFSSDGRVGMGGLDIFKAAYVDGKTDQPINMGFPINSPQDDFAFITTGSLYEGYLSSNRMNGSGGDDIYAFRLEKPVYRITGVAYNKKTGTALSHAIISLSRKNGTMLKKETAADGKFAFDLDKAGDFKLMGEKTNFLNDVALIGNKNFSSTTRTAVQDLYLDSIQINQAIKLENIYYDFDKWAIRPDAAIELDKLVKIMEDNPTIWIELGSHTDSRGKDAYNLRLSQRRANSAVEYIIHRGISSNRIIAKGYGETQLVNKCANNVSCPEWMHEENRRTEFKIIKY